MVKRSILSVLLLSAALGTFWGAAMLVWLAATIRLPWWLGIAALLVIGQFFAVGVYLAVAAWRTLRTSEF